MPRRNKRVETYVPLDVTPESIPLPKIREPKYGFGRDRDNAAADQYRQQIRQERAERQAAARVDKAIDWSVCVVPGCGEQLVSWGSRLAFDNPKRRDSTMELPMCYPHMAVVWAELVGFHRKRGKFAEAIADVNEMIAARQAREDVQAKADHMARQDGDIYFIRLGELVKVGWTRDLFQRVKSYGASAELLVSYPGTRDDETNLHRQLRPALAKGREWYEDGQIIAAFIAEALAKYGQPRPFEFMWTQPKRIVAGKRHR